MASNFSEKLDYERTGLDGFCKVGQRELFLQASHSLRLLCEFDLARVETSNTADLEAGTDLGWQSALRSAEHNVQKLLRRRYRGNILPGGLHFDESVRIQAVRRPVYRGLNMSWTWVVVVVAKSSVGHKVARCLQFCERRWAGGDWKKMSWIRKF